MRVLVWAGLAVLAAGLAIGGIDTATAGSKQVSVGAFSAVHAGEGLDVRVSSGPARVVIEGDESKFDQIEVRVSGGTLHVTRKTQLFRWGGWRGGVTVRVTAPQVTALHASTGSELNATGVAAGALALKANTGGTLEVAGTCTDVSAQASTGGVIRAAGLACQRATARASTGGMVDVNASVSHTADASTGGDIDLHGGGQVAQQSQSMGGTVSVQRE
jgi:hypothetical protein